MQPQQELLRRQEAAWWPPLAHGIVSHCSCALLGSGEDELRRCSNGCFSALGGKKFRRMLWLLRNLELHVSTCPPLIRRCSRAWGGLLLGILCSSTLLLLPL